MVEFGDWSIWHGIRLILGGLKHHFRRKLCSWEIAYADIVSLYLVTCTQRSMSSLRSCCSWCHISTWKRLSDLELELVPTFWLALPWRTRIRYGRFFCPPKLIHKTEFSVPFSQVGALCLINCSSTAAGWIEWGYQLLNSRNLRTKGMTQSVMDYLMWHHFGRNPEERNLDLVQVSYHKGKHSTWKLTKTTHSIAAVQIELWAFDKSRKPGYVYRFVHQAYRSQHCPNPLGYTTDRYFTEFSRITILCRMVLIDVLPFIFGPQLHHWKCQC